MIQEINMVKKALCIISEVIKSILTTKSILFLLQKYTLPLKKSTLFLIKSILFWNKSILFKTLLFILKVYFFIVKLYLKYTFFKKYTFSRLMIRAYMYTYVYILYVYVMQVWTILSPVRNRKHYPRLEF